MTDELTQCIAAGKITHPDAEKLQALSPGSYCKHRSWGFGRITEWHLLTDQVVIDFVGKKNHPMQLHYAVETLVPIAENHILARLQNDPETIREEAKKNPVGLIRMILENHGGAATVDEISEILVPAIFDTASFKKWFDTTKKKLKADGHFEIPTKKNFPIKLQEVKVEQHHRTLKQFHASRHPKEQVAAIDALIKTLDASTLSLEELQIVIRHLDDAARRAERLHIAKGLELLLARNEIARFHKELEPASSQPSITEFLANTLKKLHDIFAELPAAKYRRILKNFPTVFPQKWQDQSQQLLRHAEPRLISEIFHLFKEHKSEADFASILARMIQDRSASSDLLSWICEERKKAFPEFINSELLSAIISSLERDMHLEGKKGNRLQELLFTDRELISDLLATAHDDIARNIIRKIMMSPVFNDLDRRSLLARILKIHPELQSLVTGYQEKEHSTARDENLIVSWKSLERRKNEYENLINKLIPQNTKDISIARSYGDLRENFEFKSAKEQQTVLLRQKGELELLLNRARGTNFQNPDTSVVSIGTVVSLQDKVTGEKEVYSILGAWDGAPEKRWVSYQAVIGQALLGHAQGDVITLPAEKGDRSMIIEKIEPFTEDIES
jgi:transcription elongation GreA/GreB family factor